MRCERAGDREVPCKIIAPPPFYAVGELDDPPFFLTISITEKATSNA